MCGIVGYIGSRSAQPILIEGLRRLEYRGYDSAGITVATEEGLATVKQPGKVAQLKAACKKKPLKGSVGIGHTRWATHGEPNEVNAHPHTVGDISIVHNGIIENYQHLRESLIADHSATFVSETDTEVLAQLIARSYEQSKNLVRAVQEAIARVEGTYGLVVMSALEPNTLVAVRKGSPLLVGKNGKSIHIASDSAALSGRCKTATVLKDGELAICKPGSITIWNGASPVTSSDQVAIESVATTHSKGEYRDYMLKEIMEQPSSVQAVLAGRINHPSYEAHLGGLNMSTKQIKELTSIQIIACGTAYNAGMAARYFFEQLTGIPVQVEVASEFRYRKPVLHDRTLGIAISQSGETADTLAAIEVLQEQNVHTLGVVNVVGSSIATAVDGGVFTHAGPEVAVASTKAFTNMVVSLLLMGLFIGKRRGLPLATAKEVIDSLDALPKQIEQVLQQHNGIKKQASKWSKYNNALFMGRDNLYPIAVEGALKLKEISYIHAEGVAAGELKHGTLALVDDTFLNVYLLGRSEIELKAISNLQEIKARDGNTLVIGDIASKEVDIRIPSSSRWTQGLLFNVVLQLLAYEVAKARKTNIDQPRNLAKSVTVE